MPNIHSLEPYLACSHALADLAAAETIRWFRGRGGVENKAGDGGPAGVQGAFDPVTEADRAAERAMRDEILARFPDHGIDGEEFPPANPGATIRWILDPVDGTAAFVMGWPMWGSLIALTEAQRPLIGLFDQPFTRERVWSDGAATFFRTAEGAERPLRTRPCENLRDAYLSTTHPDYFSTPEAGEAFAAVRKAARTTRFGGDCYAYVMLAAGYSDLIVESGLKPHDIAALIPIIEAAGGVVTTWDGAPAAAGGNIVAAGDPRVHQAALKLLSI